MYKWVIRLDSYFATHLISMFCTTVAIQMNGQKRMGVQEGTVYCGVLQSWWLGWHLDLMAPKCTTFVLMFWCDCSSRPLSRGHSAPMHVSVFQANLGIKPMQVYGRVERKWRSLCWLSTQIRVCKIPENIALHISYFQVDLQIADSYVLGEVWFSRGIPCSDESKRS